MRGIKTLASLILGGSLALGGCNSGVENLTETIQVYPSDNLPSPDKKQKGMNFVSWWYQDYKTDTAVESLENLRATNCEWVSILVTWYQKDSTSTEIYRKEQKTHDDESLFNMINQAHRLGMNIMLKPHVDLEGGSWRGNIGGFLKETDYENWFRSYKSFINHYAEFAEKNKLGQLCIGTEFVGLTKREKEWREVIKEVRERFKGKLVYSENHDNLENNNWFGDLDFIGVSGYFPLTKKLDPTIEELDEAWKVHKEKIIKVQEKFNKKILFTEVGYRSSDGANIVPWAKADFREQADCYKAFFNQFWNEPWVIGSYFWNWEAGNTIGQAEEFSPQKREAEQVLTEEYSKD